MIGDVKMRRFEAEIRDKSIINEILSQIPFVTVGINTDDYPYVVPMNFGYELTDDKLIVYLHCAKEGQKVDLWRKDPRVSLTFSMFTNHPRQTYRGTMHDFRCVMANGIIRQIVRGKDKGHGRAVQAILSHNDRRPNQFSVPHYMFMDVYVVECDWSHVTAKSECPVHDVNEVTFVSDDELAKNVTEPYDETFFFNLKRYESSSEKLTLDERVFEFENTDCSASLDGRNCRFKVEWKPKEGFEEIDCDLSALLLDKNGCVPRRYNVAFYNQLTDMNECVIHEGDDILLNRYTEELLVDLAIVPDFCRDIRFIISVYDSEHRNYDLSNLEYIKISMFDEDTNELLMVRKTEGLVGPAASLCGIEVNDEGKALMSYTSRALSSSKMTAIFRDFGLLRWKE